MKQKRKKRSKIWFMPSNEFKNICQQATSIGQILICFGLKNHGGNHLTIRQRAEEEQIDLSHIKRGLDSNKGKKFGYKPKIDDKDLFVKDSITQRSVVRNRIIKKNLIPYICCECKQKPIWRKKKLSLVLDHINGINNDHRLENLRFLCPNCNSQTETFCGRKNKLLI